MKWHGNSSSENFLEAWGAFVVTNSPQRLSHPGRRHTEMEGVSGGLVWFLGVRCPLLLSGCSGAVSPCSPLFHSIVVPAFLQRCDVTDEWDDKNR